MKKILQIVESAYRGTLEEQDDTVIWLSHIMRASGCDLDIILKGNAVNYLLESQDASGLVFGRKIQTQPPRIFNDIIKILNTGVDIYYILEDANDRGIERKEIFSGVKSVLRQELPNLFLNYRYIFHW